MASDGWPDHGSALECVSQAINIEEAKSQKDESKKVARSLLELDKALKKIGRRRAE